MPFKIDRRSLRLPDAQYVSTKTPKDLIVLHHTVGGSATSTFRYWVNAVERVGCAFLVDRDGKVYETFPPTGWASHIGLKHQVAMERRSIGIEICNYGPLTKLEDKYYILGRISEATEFRGKVYDGGTIWRNTQYFEEYTPEQVASVTQLVKVLQTRFNIPNQKFHGTDQLAAYADFKGVTAHCNLRPEKTDIHLGFDWSNICSQP